MSTSSLPTTNPSDERAGGGALFWGLAVPFMLGALMICAGLVVGGTIGLILAFGSFLLFTGGVVAGIWSFVKTDDE